MSGFDSKRQASLDTLNHIGYQGRETRPDELAPKPVAWISEYGVQELTFDNPALGSLEWEVKRNYERGHDVPLYLHLPAQPAVAEPLTDDELRECFTGTNTAEPLSEGWPGLKRFARAVEQAHGIKGSAA